jgi:hypothetical protein
VKAGGMPLNIVQRYLNRWIPVSNDLFGADQSISGITCGGLKGRYEEAQTREDTDLGHMEQHNRRLCHAECQNPIGQISKYVPRGQPSSTSRIGNSTVTLTNSPTNRIA